MAASPVAHVVSALGMWDRKRRAGGGPIALLQNGDKIVIDAVAGTIDVLLSDEVLAERRAQWKPRTTDYNSGAIWKFAQLVGPAHLGAVTHPGGAAETHCYADI